MHLLVIVILYIPSIFGFFAYFGRPGLAWAGSNRTTPEAPTSADPHISRDLSTPDPEDFVRREAINICSTHHSRDLSTPDPLLRILHGSRDGTPLDTHPEKIQPAHP
jgi:hypothetical protein